jgi:hypothetical protein
MSANIDESEIHKLIANHFLPDRALLQWRHATNEDLPTLNSNEIVVFSSFFQCGFGLLTVTPTFCKNKVFVQIGVHIKL